jgi:SAM-dependent methyltransferase
MKAKSRLCCYVFLGLIAGLVAPARGVYGAETQPAAARAAQILESAGIRGGLIVHLGCGTGELASALRAGDRYLVHGLDADPQNVEAARKQIRSHGRYGPVSVAGIRGATLPYADNTVNVIVSEGPTTIPAGEIRRVLTPLGAALIDGKKTVKPWPADIDEWTHFLHEADNNPVARDTQVGPPKHLQWVAGPLWARSHEIHPSIVGMVSAGGRMFYLHDAGPIGVFDETFPNRWVLIARDAFNGTLLWKRDVGNWTASVVGWLGVRAEVNRRLIASTSAVYAGLGGGRPVTA